MVGEEHENRYGNEGKDSGRSCCLIMGPVSQWWVHANPFVRKNYKGVRGQRWLDPRGSPALFVVERRSFCFSLGK